MNMKKILFSLVCLIFVLSFTTGCNQNNDRFIEITFAELSEKLEQELSFPLYIGSARCRACTEFQPVLKRVIRNHDFTVYHIDLTTLNEEEQNGFNNLFNINATPSLIYVVNGSEMSTLNRVIGNVSQEELINSLRDNGYIE